MRLVIGIGNEDRGDDAAGLLVARQLRAVADPRVVGVGVGVDVDADVNVVELAGDELSLLTAWAGASAVYVIDAIRSGAPAGTVRRFTATRPLTSDLSHRGTHLFSLADVLEVGRATGRVPAGLVGYGIEGARWGLGDPLSPEVKAAIDAVAKLIASELKAGE